MTLNFKSLSAACFLSTSALVGCSHTNNASPTPPPGSKPAATLQSHHWQLQQATNAQGVIEPQWQLPALDTQTPQGARKVSLHFLPDQTISVDRLCNTILGKYETQAQSIKINRMISTMMACSNADLMRLEQQVAHQLPQVRSWKITHTATPILELQFDNGAIWQLKGTPTHETLYGQSEHFFLEVAAQKTPCNTPLMPTSQCLQVRTVEYDQKGLSTNKGPWGAFYEPIEGYTHQNGVRNVLRVKRYTKGTPPADASKYIYVLDMAIESEIER